MTRWTVENEVSLLQRYAKNSRHGIVEIGVFDGETTAKMAEVSSVSIYGIDPLVPDSMPPFELGSEINIRRNMSPFGNRFTFYKDYSYNIVEKFNFPFDILFIDGSHLYSDVAKDFLDWWPKLISPGYCLFHDSAPTEDGRFDGWPGPTQLTNEIEIAGNIKLVERIDTIKVFRK
jgi:hypothetical protein